MVGPPLPDPTLGLMTPAFHAPMPTRAPAEVVAVESRGVRAIPTTDTRRHTMRSTCPRSPAARCAALVLMLAGSVPMVQAADQVGGECSLEGKTLGFVDGVVYQRPYPFDETRQETVVALAEFMLDKA